MTELYLQPHQVRKHEPSVYENLLADALERAYGNDVTEIEALVTYLNDHGPEQQGHPHIWTADSLAAELKRLGADE